MLCAAAHKGRHQCTGNCITRESGINRSMPDLHLSNSVRAEALQEVSKQRDVPLRNAYTKTRPIHFRLKRLCSGWQCSSLLISPMPRIIWSNMPGSAHLMHVVRCDDRDATVHGSNDATLAPTTTRGSQAEHGGGIVPEVTQGQEYVRAGSPYPPCEWVWGIPGIVICARNHPPTWAVVEVFVHLQSATKCVPAGALDAHGRSRREPGHRSKAIVNMNAWIKCMYSYALCPSYRLPDTPAVSQLLVVCAVGWQCVVAARPTNATCAGMSGAKGCFSKGLPKLWHLLESFAAQVLHCPS